MKDSDSSNDDATMELLQLLSTQIALDGGASLVVNLKEYAGSRPKYIDALLKKSIGSKKLLTFLEKHPTIFQVDRESIPHFVKLLSNEYYGDGSLLEESTSNIDDDIGSLDQKNSAKQALHEKAVYVLRKRAAKIARRQRSEDRQEVNLDWLAKECATLLHYYLRTNGYYQKTYASCEDVQIMGTPPWYIVVLSEFELFLQQYEDDFVVEPTAGKVRLKEEESQGNNSDVQGIQTFATRLRELVNEDGGTHARLSLLLHRNPDLKALLGGRDFLACAERHPTLFLELVITKYESDVELQLTSKPLGGEAGGRMDVDETGLFSVASSKWGTAMANIMVWACSAALSLGDLDPTKMTAIDLTASVGGFTLALAKTAFSRVIAVEIDSHRAELCRQNMLKHGMEDVVDVRNSDAMELLPSLAEELRICDDRQQQQTVVVLDPPWGGIHYKQEKNPIFMGPWALEEVIQKVATHLAPTIVGIRLPVNFEVRRFLEDVRRDRNLVFETLNIRKLGPQLFVVLAFCDKEQDRSSNSTKTMPPAT